MISPLKMKIFLLQLFFAFSSFVQSSKTKCNAIELLREYKRYKIDKKDGRESLETYLESYYQENSLECIKLAYIGDWSFRLIFFSILRSPHRRPKEHKKFYYEFMLEDIDELIRLSFLEIYPAKEEKEKHFEGVKLLIKIAQETVPKINEHQIQYYQKLILCFKFLNQNFSFDYERKTIDYHSFFSSLCNIIRLIGESQDLLNDPSQELVNNSTLFITYSFRISKKNCLFLFGYQGMEHLKPLAIFYIQKFIRTSCMGSFLLNLSKCIKDLIGILEGNVLPEIRIFLDHYSGDFLAERLNFYGLIVWKDSFTDLERFIDYERIKPCDLWSLKGMIILEQYLIHKTPHNKSNPQ